MPACSSGTRSRWRSRFEGHDGLAVQAAAFAAVTLLVLFLSALGIFSLVSVGVSRRTREIGPAHRSRRASSPGSRRHPVARDGAHVERVVRQEAVSCCWRSRPERAPRAGPPTTSRSSRAISRQRGGDTRGEPAGGHRTREASARNQSERGAEGNLTRAAKRRSETGAIHVLRHARRLRVVMPEVRLDPAPDRSRAARRRSP
jgi:hypothetical protein